MRYALNDPHASFVLIYCILYGNVQIKKYNSCHPKPNMDKTTSYRPISLLSVIADTGEEPSSLHNCKHTHATQIQNTTLYSDGTTHIKQHYLQQCSLHNKHSYRPPHSHCNILQNKCVPYTYIYCLYPQEANITILHTPPPHISSSEEILPQLTRHTLVQVRTNKSSFLKSYLCKVNAKSDPSPVCLLYNCNTHTHHLFNCIHIHTKLSDLDLRIDPAGVTALMPKWTGTNGLPPLTIIKRNIVM